MKLSIKIIVGTAIVAASVVAATFSASAPARASDAICALRTGPAVLSARHLSADRSGALSLPISELLQRADSLAIVSRSEKAGK